MVIAFIIFMEASCGSLVLCVEPEGSSTSAGEFPETFWSSDDTCPNTLPYFYVQRLDLFHPKFFKLRSYSCLYCLQIYRMIVEGNERVLN